MAILVECPNCKKRLSANAKICQSKPKKGEPPKGCGAKIPFGTRIYWVSYRDPNGKTKQKRIGPSKTAAEIFEKKVKVEVVEGKYIDRKEEIPKVLIKDFIDDSYTPWCKANNRGYDSKKFCIAKIVDLWGGKNLDELSDEDIERYKWQMLKAKKTVMFNRVLSAISHMYTIAVEFGKIERAPIKTAKKRIKEKGRLRYLLPDEVQTLLDACSKHLKPIVITALHTGMRKSEILNLKLAGNLDLGKRLISLALTKNDETRHIPVNETLLGVLKPLAEGKEPGALLFANRKGNPFDDIGWGFRAALKRANINDFHFHDLRHTFASNLVMNGVDLFAVKELLGHKDIKMTMKYAHLSPEHRTMAVKVLDRVYGDKIPETPKEMFEEAEQSRADSIGRQAS
jgi:integrase